MALDIADTVYVPDVAEHVPGVANVGPDVLSRRFAPRTPGTAWELPARLAGIDGCTPPLRDESQDFAPAERARAQPVREVYVCGRDWERGGLRRLRMRRIPHSTYTIYPIFSPRGTPCC